MIFDMYGLEDSSQGGDMLSGVGANIDQTLIEFYDFCLINTIVFTIG